MKRGGGPGRPASSGPLSGMSGQPDGGRLAGRVLAYLYNPGRAKKVPEKMEKVARILAVECPLEPKRGNLGACALRCMGPLGGEAVAGGRTSGLAP